MVQLQTAALLCAAAQWQPGAALGLFAPRPKAVTVFHASVGGGSENQWDHPQGPFWATTGRPPNMGPRVRAVDQRFSNGRVPYSGAVEGSAADRRSSSASSSDTEDRNYYPPSALDALGLKNGCSAADVKAAYRKLVKDVHPDRDPSPEAAARYLHLTQSYERVVTELKPLSKRQELMRRAMDNDSASADDATARDLAESAAALQEMKDAEAAARSPAAAVVSSSADAAAAAAAAVRAAAVAAAAGDGYASGSGGSFGGYQNVVDASYTATSPAFVDVAATPTYAPVVPPVAAAERSPPWQSAQQVPQQPFVERAPASVASWSAAPADTAPFAAVVPGPASTQTFRPRAPQPPPGAYGAAHSSAAAPYAGGEVVAWTPVVFGGCAGTNAASVNGVYLPTGDLYNGKPLYQKQGDVSKWLRFVATNARWSVSTREDKDLQNAHGWCESIEAHASLPTHVQQWQVYSDCAWAVQPACSCVAPGGDAVATLQAELAAARRLLQAAQQHTRDVATQQRARDQTSALEAAAAQQQLQQHQRSVREAEQQAAAAQAAAQAAAAMHAAQAERAWQQQQQSQHPRGGGFNSEGFISSGFGTDLGHGAAGVEATGGGLLAAAVLPLVGKQWVSSYKNELFEVAPDGRLFKNGQPADALALAAGSGLPAGRRHSPPAVLTFGAWQLSERSPLDDAVVWRNPGHALDPITWQSLEAVMLQPLLGKRWISSFKAESFEVLAGGALRKNGRPAADAIRVSTGFGSRDSPQVAITFGAWCADLAASSAHEVQWRSPGDPMDPIIWRAAAVVGAPAAPAAATNPWAPHPSDQPPLGTATPDNILRNAFISFRGMDGNTW